MGVLSEIVTRSRLAQALGFSHGGKRDLYGSFGYPETITPQMYYNMYERGDIANRIITAFPQATWRDDATIEDDSGNTDESSSFVNSISEFDKKHKMYHYLERADKLCGIGQYSLLFMSFADGGKPNEPLSSGDHELLFLQPFMEKSITITKVDNDLTSPRFGLPEEYTITSTPEEGTGATPSTAKAVNVVVHHSRVIHIAEFLDENDVFGVPRLKPVYNRLMDLEKVVGGSSEMFWLNGRGGLGIWADKDASFSTEEKEKMKEAAEDYTNQLSRFMIGKGMSFQPITLPVPDPEKNYNVIMDIIAGTAKIPRRILTGSERGELASSQDENNFSQRIEERQSNFAIPIMLMPLIDKMIETGNIEQPNGDYKVYWEKDNALNEKDLAEIASKRVAALVSYSNSTASTIVPAGEFREKFLDLPVEIDFEAYDIEIGEDDIFEVEEDQEFEDRMMRDPDDDLLDDEFEVEEEEPFENFRKLQMMNRGEY